LNFWQTFGTREGNLIANNMKTFTTTGFVTMICLSITFASCQKEAIVGPKGEQGLQGEQGVQGDKGDAGASGSNISGVGSGNFTVKTWVYDQITKEYQGYILDNRITESVLSGGGVQVFLKSAGGVFTALPTTVYPTPDVSYRTGFSVSQQNVRIELQYPDLKQGPLPGDLTFKVVVLSGSFMKTHRSIDLTNYAELAPYIGN
jgi:hypothetical protein